jgi:hypothetical protein
MESDAVPSSARGSRRMTMDWSVDRWLTANGDSAMKLGI